MTHKPLIWPTGAAVQVALGAALLGRPDDYAAPVYHEWQFAMAPRAAWGWAFLIAGILGVGARCAPSWPNRPHAQRVAAMACVSGSSALYAVWALNFTAAFFLSDRPQSVNPVLLWWFAAFAVAVDASFHGTSR